MGIPRGNQYLYFIYLILKLKKKICFKFIGSQTNRKFIVIYIKFDKN